MWVFTWSTRDGAILNPRAQNVNKGRRHLESASARRKQRNSMKFNVLHFVLSRSIKSRTLTIKSRTSIFMLFLFVYVWRCGFKMAPLPGSREFLEENASSVLIHKSLACLLLMKVLFGFWQQPIVSYRFVLWRHTHTTSGLGRLILL